MKKFKMCYYKVRRGMRKVFALLLLLVVLTLVLSGFSNVQPAAEESIAMPPVDNPPAAEENPPSNSATITITCRTAPVPPDYAI